MALQTLFNQGNAPSAVRPRAHKEGQENKEYTGRQNPDIGVGKQLPVSLFRRMQENAEHNAHPRTQDSQKDNKGR